MKNKYLQILIKGKTLRSIGENAVLIHFWRNCTPQEYRLAHQIESFINPKQKIL